MNTSNELPAAELPDQIRLLETHAAELIQTGRHEDAERIYNQILKAAPRNMTALRYFVGRAIEKQDLPHARKLLERAIEIAPRKPELFQNLAVILRAQGHLKDALLAFNTALRLDTQQPLCWIQRGDVLQALGRRNEAIAAYYYAATISGNLAILAQAHQGNQQALNIIKRAALELVSAREKAISRATAGLLDNHGRESMQRAFLAGRHMARAIPPDYADPLQRPSYCYFPGLGEKPFYDRSEFPFLKDLEAASVLITNELKNLLETEARMHPYVKIDSPNPAQWKELNYSDKWSSYHLLKAGKRVEEHCARCPETLRAVESLPLASISRQAPEAFFSILQPGTHIPPHYGLANYKLAVHLPLIIPGSCGIRVGDVTRNWKPGRCLIFDDSYEHEAWNHSDEIRAVLILEIWNPNILDSEKDYLNRTAEALNDFAQDMETVLSRPS